MFDKKVATAVFELDYDIYVHMFSSGYQHALRGQKGFFAFELNVTR